MGVAAADLIMPGPRSRRRLSTDISTVYYAMKFEISDDAVLKLVGVGSAVHSVHWLADGKGAHKFHFAESVPYDDTTARQYGWALAGLAAMPLAISAAEGGKDAKKNALKASGATWLAGSALLAYNGHEHKGGQEENLMYAAAVGHAALGALCLWRGLAEDEKWEKTLFEDKDKD
ncbi:hypothetical protein COHA_007391 [Chlorella ohadii]|uniref:Uncharacterized protein n=1 Tax=Chlorella ohadii TaxID=2649997 RepID=A0AAD5H3G1_9CHLO|nr:hypothetical protein COHA_007391 [Chlorella ohadii]